MTSSTNVGGTPVGTVLIYVGRSDGAGVLNLMTSGWVLCDGSVYPATQFPDLFAVISDSFGGSESGFAVPSFKGVFLRGVDGTDPAGRDPDAASRAAPRSDLANAGNSGNAVGSFQADQLGSHTHDYEYYDTYLKSTRTLGHKCLSGQKVSTTSSVGGAETRPVNQYVNFIVKAVAAPDAIPVGAVVPYAGDPTSEAMAGALADAGWLPCTGTKESASAFPDLYQAIANSFGADDQSSFRLPDFRGRFLRGVVGQLLPGQISLDPDYLTRTAPQPTLAYQGNTANQVGSLEASEVASHTHSYTWNNDYWNTAATAIGPSAETNASQTRTTAAGPNLAETRPLNLNVNYLIKVMTA